MRNLLVPLLVKYSLLVMVSFIFLINLQTYGQEISPQHYYCFQTEKEISVDGVIDDRPWQEAPWSHFFVDIEGNQRPLPYYNTRMKMLWDKSFLYIAAELEEPHIWGTFTERESILYRENDFEVFIDPDGDGLDYYEFEINALGTEFDLKMPKPYKSGGIADIPWDFKGIRSAVKTYGSINQPGDVDTMWTVEIAIPWSAMTETGPPVYGDRWRINFSRVQWNTEVKDGAYVKIRDNKTEKFLPEQNWVWSPQGVINMHKPEMWGHVHFINEAPDISEVEHARNDVPKFWVWMGGNKNRSTEGWDSLFSKLRGIGIGGVLSNAGAEILQKIIPIASDHNIEVHAWFWTMNRGDADPDWFSVNQKGYSLAEQKAYVDYYKFMCPAVPEVKAFLLEKMDRLASVDGLKGIHMDYIRYVDAILPIGLQPKYNLVQDHVFPEYDYGYHPFMRKLYREETGIEPFDLDDPAVDQEWLQFRLDELNKTVWLLRDRVRSQNIDISAAVFPTPSMSKEMVRQEWNKWEIDYYFPMVYHNFYNESFDWIKSVMKENKASLPEDSKVFCGLYLPALQGNDDLTSAVKAAFDGGADGIAFFSYGSFDETLIKQIEKIIRKNK